jgi:hypothetical protein
VRQNQRLRAYLEQRFSAPDNDPGRRRSLVDDWVAGLRRHARVVNLYKRVAARGPGAGSSRLKPEWLTSGATTDRRRTY